MIYFVLSLGQLLKEYEKLCVKTAGYLTFVISPDLFLILARIQLNNTSIVKVYIRITEFERIVPRRWSTVHCKLFEWHYTGSWMNVKHDLQYYFHTFIHFFCRNNNYCYIRYSIHYRVGRFIIIYSMLSSDTGCTKNVLTG